MLRMIGVLPFTGTAFALLIDGQEFKLSIPPKNQGRKVVLPWGGHPASCPVRAVKEWLERVKIMEGFLFRGVVP